MEQQVPWKKEKIDVAVIIPTFREAENLPFLIPRLASALADAGLQGEIIIVDDDSQDGTVDLCRRMAAQYPIRLLVREQERGLSTAVVHGMLHADADVLVVMDADLSHPPERIPDLVAAVAARKADFAVGSRYVSAGRTDESWGVIRWLESKIANMLALPLTSARDPMSGFFAIRRETFLRANALNPIGYKIGLELMVKCGCRKVKEIPIHFQNRRLGKSKLTLREQINYLVHLVGLYNYRFERLSCFVKFCLVGATGLGVDLAMFTLLLGFLPLFAARALAIWIAMSWNFLLNRQFTFGIDRRHRILKQYILFCISCLGGAVLNWGISVGLSHQTVFFGGHPLLAAFLGVVAGAGLNYLFSRHITFQLNPAKTSDPTPCRCTMLENQQEGHRHHGNISSGFKAFWDSFLTISSRENARKQTLLIGLMFGVMLGLRLLGMALVPLIPEEAYYWMYAQHPALSYFDHPPMVAWLIGLGTAIFGDTEFGVRIVGNLLMIGASVLMYQFGRAWFGIRAGVLAALLLQIIPVYFGTGFIATMDAALVFFWMLCLVGVTVALKEEKAWGWYIGGAGLGLAILSKYTGIFLVPGTLLAVLAHRPWRRQMLTIQPYLGILLALVLFSPVIIWNAQHDWASFRFQFLNRWDADPMNVTSVLRFLGFQILVATPVILWVTGKIVFRKVRWLQRGMAPCNLIALAFSVPLLAVMAYKSLRYGIHINWTLPAYLSIIPLAAYQLDLTVHLGADEPRKYPLRTAWAVTVISCIAINISLLVYLLAVQPRTEWVSAFGPWEQLSEIVEEYEDRLEKESGQEPLIIAEGKYRLASVLAFYRTPLEEDVRAADSTTSQWVLGGQGLGYPYWHSLEEWQGRNVLYVTDDYGNTYERLKPRFREVKLVADERLLGLGHKRYRLAVGRHFSEQPPAKTGELISMSNPSLGFRSKWCARCSSIICLDSSPAVTQK